jgi:hypothetical protein
LQRAVLGARGEASHRPQAGVGDVAIDSALADHAQQPA